MSAWEILNSAVVVTVLSLLGGGIVASSVAAMWQRRNHRYTVKLQYARDILSAYHAYVRLVNGNRTRLDTEVYHEVHAQMLSLSKIAALLFEDVQVGERWLAVATGLGDAAGFRLGGRDEKTRQRMSDVYQHAASATQAMFNELQR
jgi:hypothetical protein